MTKQAVFLHFDESLLPLVKCQPDADNTVVYQLERRASIKDIIEALGIPHTEVGKIVTAGGECAFDALPEAGEQYTILPTSADSPVTRPTLLRPGALSDLLFMVDNNVGKLARLLRMVGYDAMSVPDLPLRQVARMAVEEHRILLTRNRDLLKVKEVVFGHLLRSQEPELQFLEVADLYNLDCDKAPFSRCLECNELLTVVEKEKIINRLEPLTKKYYNNFRICPGCELIYWRGSHWENMRKKLQAWMS